MKTKTFVLGFVLFASVSPVYAADLQPYAGEHRIEAATIHTRHYRCPIIYAAEGVAHVVFWTSGAVASHIGAGLHSIDRAVAPDWTEDYSDRYALK